MKKKMEINPDYSRLESFVRRLPDIFDTEGECIYKARNELKLFNVDGYVLNVKSFKIPIWLNRIAYSCFRTSKAYRSFHNSMKVLSLGLETPTPIAYLNCMEGGLLKQSFYVSLQSSYTHSVQEFRNLETTGKEDIVAEEGRFIARMHKAGILHKDLSGGNLLFEKDEQGIHFTLVDMNRIRFCRRIGKKRGLRNMERLRGSDRYFQLLTKAYAEECAYDAEDCYRKVLRYTRRSVRAFYCRVVRKKRRKGMNTPKSVSVIISTYNNPAYLEKVLYAYTKQSYSSFDVIIADDGSSEETKLLIERYQRETNLSIKHLWQEDKGFRKTSIANKAVLASEAEYLIFTDQDCVPRADFVETHVRNAKRGYFMSAGYVYLPPEFSRRLSPEEIENASAFDLKYLRANGLRLRFKMLKLSKCRMFTCLMNHVTTAKSSWNGCNSSGWKGDIMTVNGMNERMGYGGEDREMGERLYNLGVRSKQIRYSAICLHLDHERPYKSEEGIRKNREIRKDTRKKKVIYTPDGFVKF